MHKYTMKYFDTRNTCTEGIEHHENDHIACNNARVKSHNHHHIIVESEENGRWTEYELGQAVSWSYPQGLQETLALSFSE